MKPNLDKIIQDNLDKAKFQSKLKPSLPKNTGWLDGYADGGLLSKKVTCSNCGWLSKYENGSVVDYLADKNQDFSYSHRKEIAKELGIENYRGTAEQNFLKDTYGIKKMGGEPCYNCGGMYNKGGQTNWLDKYK